jgi:hypothetical protein
MTARDWNPKHTKVIILGLGLADWADPEDPIGDRDIVLHQFFKKSGIPSEQNIHIRDEKGDYKNMMKFLPDFLADSDEDSFLIFYYAGHGNPVEDSDYEYDVQFCHPEKDSLSLGNLIDCIEENFAGWTVLLLADCCYSGNIARFASNTDSEFYYAGLSSALSTKTSTGAWTFSDCVLSALQGEAQLDSDENGSISLQELADYVKEQMKEIDDQKSDFGYNEGYDTGMRLAVVRK